MKISWTVKAGLASGGVVFLLAIAFSIVVAEGQYKAARNISLSLLAALSTAATTTAVATVADQSPVDRSPQQPGPKPTSIPLPPNAAPPVPQPIDLGPRKHPYEIVKEVLGEDLEQQLTSISVQVGATSPMDAEQASRLFDSTSRLIEVAGKRRKPTPQPPSPPSTEDEIDLPDVPRGEAPGMSPLILEDEWFSGPEIQHQASNHIEPRAYPPEYVTHEPERTAPTPPAPKAPPAKKNTFGGMPLL